MAVESISHLQRRRKNERQKAQLYTMLAAFCWVRQRKITDYLVDLFIRILNDIRLRAKSRVEKQLMADYIKVGGKQQLLFQLATNNVGQSRPALSKMCCIHSLAKNDWKHWLKKPNIKALTANLCKPVSAAHTRIIIAKYCRYHWRCCPSAPTMSNTNPLSKHWTIVAAYLEEKDAYYPEDQEVPMDDVIQKQWQNWIYQKDSKGQRRIRRVRYELCVLQSLREKLRCKEIWVEAANHYRNPDEDVPADFSDKRDEYYDALNLPKKRQNS